MSEVLLGELLNSKGITYGVVKPGDHETNGIPLIKAADVANGRVNTTPNFRISQEKHQEHNRTELNGGELLITLVGTPGQCAIAPPEAKGFNVVRAVGVFSVNTLADSRFIMYSIQAPQSQAYIRNVCNTTVQATLNLGDLKGLPLSIPEINEQKAIAHILGTLDDKIELNRQTNETLEAMARALFKSWFVDFDPVRAKAEGRPTGLPDEISDLFPDSFEESELGEIPRDWRAAEIGDISDWRSGSTPSKASPEYWGGCIPWISANSMKDTFAISSDLSLTEAGIQNGGRLAPEGAILLLVRGSGLHSQISCCLASREMAFNQDVKAVTAMDGSSLSTNHIFAYLQAQASVLLEMVEFTGIGAGKLDTDLLKKLPISVPSQQLLAISDGFLDATYDRIKNNLISSISLCATRDALLPKLISGELRIPDAERMLAEAGI